MSIVNFLHKKRLRIQPLLLATRVIFYVIFLDIASCNLFFFNDRRVSKDPEIASLNNVGKQLQGGPLERGEIQNSPIKVQKGPWQKHRNAIRSFRRLPRRRRRSANHGRQITTVEPATWGNTASRSRGSSEASERVPYTHPVRPGGTEQAAPCRRRSAPEEDAASTQKQSFRHPPRKLRMQKGAIDVWDSTGTRETRRGLRRAAIPPPPPTAMAGSAPARIGDSHAASSALASLAATAGQGEYQASRSCRNSRSRLLGNLIEGPCHRWLPGRDPPRIWEEVAVSGLPGAVPEHQEALSLCRLWFSNQNRPK
jgi:hypothetical protein